MKDATKLGLALLGVGTVTGVVLMAKRKPAPPEGVTIKIEVLDAEGRVLKGSSPIPVTEGGSYTVRLTVKNASTKAGTLVAVTLGIGISAATETVQLLAPLVVPTAFGPGETKSFTFPFAIPLDTGGTTGGISAWVQDPTGKTIASAPTVSLNIAAIAIDYAASISIG